MQRWHLARNRRPASPGVQCGTAFAEIGRLPSKGGRQLESWARKGPIRPADVSVILEYWPEMFDVFSYQRAHTDEN